MLKKILDNLISQMEKLDLKTCDGRAYYRKIILPDVKQHTGDLLKLRDIFNDMSDPGCLEKEEFEQAYSDFYTEIQSILGDL